MTTSLLFPSKKTTKSRAILAAARALMPALVRGVTIDAKQVKIAMDFAFGGTDANGGWIWKDAYDAQEVASVLTMVRNAPLLARLESTPSAVVAFLAGLSKLGMTHTRRSEEQVSLDQWSTPPHIAALAVLAAQVRPNDRVLEPSAGTGLIAALCQACGALLTLNELADTRSALLKDLFPTAQHLQADGRLIADLCSTSGSFDAVVMNPPFQGIEQHLSAAFRALADGGRMSAIVPASFLDGPGPLALARAGKIQTMLAFPNRAFAKHGTSVETGLVVVDRIAPREGLPRLVVPETLEEAIATLQGVEPRLTAKPRDFLTNPFAAPRPASAALRSAKFGFLANPVPIGYDVVEFTGKTRDVGIYSAYEMSRVHFHRPAPHPGDLVESSSMATTPMPPPTFIPMLPLAVQDKLSDPQKEVLIYAGQAHEQFLDGWWKLDAKGTSIINCKDQEEKSFRVRRGFYCGDGTGCGKGRIFAGLIASYFASLPEGAKRQAVVISKNDSLYQDALRDWTAIGGQETDIVLQSTFKLGSTIRMDNGILFSTYGTLRQAGRLGKSSRLHQIVQWLGAEYEGLIIFDEAHAMANAMVTEGERGIEKASQQGLAGLLLQYSLPASRVVYLSATGATEPQDLAYATRLGLWGSPEAPFMSRDGFMEAADAGGTSFLEVICRELKALGLYVARSLSFEGVEVDGLRHDLTPEDEEIYNTYADAFQVILGRLEHALAATNQSGSSAKSAFYGMSMRFFNSLLSSLKVPTLLRDMEEQLAIGRACVTQLVTTNESVLNRRLEAADPSTFGDLAIDLSPKDVIREYLQHAFPTQLFETVTEADGKESVRPVRDADGNTVECQEALRLRDDMLLDIALLPSMPAVLDAVLQHFGSGKVAEVTGRSKRVLTIEGRQVLERRSKSAAQADINAFMDGEKNLILFTDAGGTGKSYHDDRNCRNDRRRVHYLAEPGFKATAALQGLGRSHRSNARTCPIFRPVTTSTHGEKRFISVISRRLASLGALTRGERRTGGNGLFRAEDDLENAYARRALVSFLHAMASNEIDSMSREDFQTKTGLNLFDKDGNVLESARLPKMNQFLNRLLALRIKDQDKLFAAFEERLIAILDHAREMGQLDLGVSDLVYEDLELIDERIIRTDPTGAETKLIRYNAKQRLLVSSRQDMDRLVAEVAWGRAELIVNKKSGRVGVAELGLTTCNAKDGLERAVRIHRPNENYIATLKAYEDSAWEVVDQATWSALWDEQFDACDKFGLKTVNLVTGLLLPVWKHISREGRVYRLLAPNGERLLGRVLNDLDVERMLINMGLAHASDTFKDVDQVIERIMTRSAIVDLGQGLYLKRSRVMDRYRLEITGNSNHFRELKRLGCAVEIITHATRIFVPTGDTELLRCIFKAFPPQRYASMN